MKNQLPCGSKLFGVAVGLLLALFLGGCGGPEIPETTYYLAPDGSILPVQSKSKREQKKQPQEQGYWNGDGVSGKPSITIDLSDQKAIFFKGGEIVGMAPVSTGREGYGTPDGVFRILDKDQDHHSSLYGDYVDAGGNVVVANVDVNKDPRPAGTHFEGAPMPYFMRITNGIGLHAGYLPGYPASHGCIRMPKEMAEIYYANAPVGTRVHVVH